MRRTQSDRRPTRTAVGDVLFFSPAAFRLTSLRVLQRPLRLRSARQVCHLRVVTDGRSYRPRENGTLMGKKKIEQDLRDAGLRKKRARKMAQAADRSRAGDRAARELVEQHSTALRDSVSAVVRHAKPPRTKASAKKSPANSTSTKRAPARRSTSKSTARKAPTKKAVSGRGAATRGRTTRTPRARSTRRRSQPAR